ncbi:MAG TPA: MFS transporter [Nocardioides sp.]|nr:MFS transporter [Nocardioides sp.]
MNRPVLINADFSRLLVGESFSALGNVLFDTTVVLWIGTVLLRGSSYAPAAVSGVLVCVAVGTILVAPMAGVLVDRWNKRRTMLVNDLIRAPLVAVLAVVVAMHPGVLPVQVSLALAYAVVLLATASSQFFRPAYFTLIADVVHDDADRARATGMLQASATTAAIAGPPLAAPLLFTVGAQWALWVDAATFLVSFATIRLIRVDPAEAEGGTDAEPGGLGFQLVAGLRFLAGNRVIFALTVAVVVATLGTGAINTLDVFFVTANLHVSAHWYGALGMAEGVGALWGALTAGWLCARYADVRVFVGAMLAAGLLLVAYSRARSLWPAVVLLALAGLANGWVNTAISPILYREVPRALLGRVISVVNPIQQLASMFSALVSGWLVSDLLRGFDVSVGSLRLRPIDTVFSVCGLLFLVAGLAAGVVLPAPGSPGVRAAGRGRPARCRGRPGRRRRGAPRGAGGGR